MARGLARAFPSLYFWVQIDRVDAIGGGGGGGGVDDIHTGGHNRSHSLTREGTKDHLLLHQRPDHSDSTASTRRIKVTFREKGMPQPATGAAVYILHLASVGEVARAEIARAELFRHLRPLRVSGGILLVLTTRLLPEPGSLPHPGVESVARARDLSMLQLADEGEMEMSELLQIIESVTDEFGKLVVANELRSHNGLILALALKHLQHGG